jgi:hypothetical protein
MNNTSPTKSRGRTQVHRNGKQFLAALLAHRRVTLVTKPAMSSKRKRRDCDYEKREHIYDNL